MKRFVWKSLGKRAVLALLATLLGIALGTAVNLALVMMIDQKSPPGLKGLLASYGTFLALTAILGYPGWLAGLVVVTPFAEAWNWRLWAWLILGTLIGPTSICFRLGWPFGTGHLVNGDAWFYVWAAVDAGLTTLAYLVLLRRNSRATEDARRVTVSGG